MLLYLLCVALLALNFRQVELRAFGFNDRTVEVKQG